MPLFLTALQANDIVILTRQRMKADDKNKIEVAYFMSRGSDVFRHRRRSVKGEDAEREQNLELPALGTWLRAM